MRTLQSTIFMILGGIFVLLGVVGIFIPVLPTTPLLLLAAFFFARSSEWALNWLLSHRWFGAYIRNYHDGLGMTLANKIITIGWLWLTIAASIVLFVENMWVRLLLLVIACAVSAHLLRVKTYRPNASQRPIETGLDAD